MKIKKVLKITAAITASIGATIGAVIASNKIIFRNARKKDSDFSEGEYYNWEHGNIHYIKKGSGKPLLLVHGLTIGSSHREFYKNIDNLSKTFTVYAVDLPGYGYSDKPKITYTAFIYASCLNKFITDVVGKPCSIIGANGGGMLATITAKLFPNNITGLTLISPTGISGPMAENDDVYTRTLNELPLIGETIYTSSTSKSKIKKFLVEDGFFAKELVDDELINTFYFSAHGTNTDARYSYASFITNFINMDIKEYYKHTTQPISVIWGENNTLNPVINMDILKEIKPNANYYLFEETKLFPHIENSEEFNHIVSGNI